MTPTKVFSWVCVLFTRRTMIGDVDDMYDGLEALPGTAETCCCRTCWSIPACQLQHLVTAKCHAAAFVGHFLRVSIRNGNVDTTFRDEVLAILFRTRLYVSKPGVSLTVSVGAGLAAAQVKGFRVRDPRVGATMFSDACELDRIQALDLGPWKPFEVCPTWLDSVDCVLDIPTVVCVGTGSGVCSYTSSPIISMAMSKLQTHINSGRVHACLGFDREYTYTDTELTLFQNRLETLYTAHSGSGRYYQSGSSVLAVFEYDLRDHHIPETLVVHYSGNGGGSPDTIILNCGGCDEPCHVVVCPDVCVWTKPAVQALSACSTCVHCSPNRPSR